MSDLDRRQDHKTIMGTDEHAVLDLVALRRAAGALIACYDRHLDNNHVDTRELERARGDVERHLPLPGRLGRDLNIVLGNYSHSSAQEVASAVERIRALSTPAIAPREGQRSRRTRRKGRAAVAQPSLPGLEESDE